MLIVKSTTKASIRKKVNSQESVESILRKKECLAWKLLLLLQCFVKLHNIPLSLDRSGWSEAFLLRWLERFLHTSHATMIPKTACISGTLRRERRQVIK